MDKHTTIYMNPFLISPLKWPIFLTYDKETLSNVRTVCIFSQCNGQYF